MNKRLQTFGEKMTRGVFLMSVANVFLVATLIVVLRPALVSAVTEAYISNLSDYVKEDIRYTLLVGDDVSTSSYLESFSRFPLIYSISLYDDKKALKHKFVTSGDEVSHDSFPSTGSVYTIGDVAHLNQPVYTSNMDGDNLVAGYIHIAVDSSPLLSQALKFMYLAVFGLIVGSIALAFAMRSLAMRESRSITQLNYRISGIRLDELSISPIDIVPDSIEIENMQREFNILLKRVSINKLDLEEIVKERTSELADAMTARSRSEAVRRSLIMNLSHDLKTPLASNMMYLDHVIELVEESDADGHHLLPLLRKSRNSSLQLRNEIKTLLQFSSLSDVEDEITVMEFDITELVDEAISFTSELSRVSGNKVSYSHIGRVQYKSSRRLLSFVLENVLTNANKACKAGSITINSEVKLNGDLVLVVHDTGIGIPADEQEYIFEKHFQVNTKGHVGPRGMGIGLSLARMWIDQLGGQISVASDLGEYTEFTIVLTEN